MNSHRLSFILVAALCAAATGYAEDPPTHQQCEDARKASAAWNQLSEADQATKIAAHETAPEIPVGCGHLIGLTFGGVVVSQQAEKVSQADPFLGFIVGYNSKDRSLGRFRFRVQGVFQADGRTATAPVENTTTTTSPTPAPPPQLPTYQSFVSSRRSFDASFQFGWEFRPLSNILGLAPYAEIGLNSLLDAKELESDDVSVTTPATTSTAANTNTARTGTVRLNTGLAISDNDVKRFHELGLMANLYNGDRRALFVQTMVGYGYYEAFDGLAAGHNTKHRVIARLRVFPKSLDLRLGRTVDLVPLFGVDLNAGRGPDYLRIFTGFAINLRKSGGI